MVSILGANSVSGGYEVSNSLRFNDGDSASLNRTLSGSGTQGTYTFSAWIKRSVIGGSYMYLFSHRSSDDGNAYGLAFHTSNNTLYVYAGAGVPETTEVFRDPAAWYHIVLSVNSTSYTLYVNGTSIKTGTAQSLVYGKPFNVGNYNYSSGSNYFDGYMTEVHFIDGTAKAATDFGETNDNGVWIPKAYTGAYGTNGFFLEFKQTGTSQNASGIGADTSGQDNHLAVTNLAATDVTEDTCTNNFCTMNPIYSYTGITFSEGNLQTNLGGSNHRWGTGTFFVESGKWYFECKVLSDNNLNSGPGVIAYGIDDPLTTEGGGAGSKAEGWIYLATSNGQLQHGNSTYGTASAATTNDILMVAFDVDNGKIWIGKNGTWSEGSNPSTGNGAVREDLGDASSGLFTPAISGYNENFQFNFGNPPFSISSGNTDGKYGNFEYAPPSGYYALCTKRLAEFG